MKQHLRNVLVLGTVLFMSGFLATAVSAKEPSPTKQRFIITSQGSYCEGLCGPGDLCC